MKDTSQENIVSHLRLQDELKNNRNFLNSRDYTRDNLLLLGDAYLIPFSKRSSKTTLASDLAEEILAIPKMPNSFIFCDQGASKTGNLSSDNL